MLIRPQVYEDQVYPTKENSFKSKTFKNEIYMSRLDKGYNAFGSIMYDVVLISEIVGDVPGSEFEFGTIDSELTTAFGKIVHHFTGVLNKKVDLSNSKEVFENLTLYPTISYATAFKDTNPPIGAIHFFKHQSRTSSKMYFKTNTNFAPIKLEEGVNYFRQFIPNALMLDVPDPRYPAMYKYNEGDIPRVMKIGPCISGKDLSIIQDLKVNDVFIDFDKEEKDRVERNSSIRALLGSSALDDYGENDPLVDRITLGNMARNIAVDFMAADIGGMEESCTLIFDNKVQNKNTGLYCGFKSLVSPFGELCPVFDTSKSMYIASEFNKICKVVLGVSSPRHYRVTLDSNQYEITVRVKIMDISPVDAATILSYGNSNGNLYDFKGVVTIKMKKSEALDDYITEHVHRQEVLKQYYN